MACFLFLLGDFATWRELIDSIEDQFAQASNNSTSCQCPARKQGHFL